MATRRKGFKPYVPPLPPAGSYDPGLDSQYAAGQRGLQDVQYDAGVTGARTLSDYNLARGQAQQGYDRGTQDLAAQRASSLRGFDWSGQDLAAARTRGTQDYQSNIALLQRSYQRLAGQQQQSANAAGVLRGGAALQAAAKRTANQASDRAPMDTTYQRFLADNQQAQDRLGAQRQDATSAFDLTGGRMGEDLQSQLGQLGLGYTRQGQDTATQLARAQREQAALGIDTTAAKAAQAAGAGWAPPGRGEPGGTPANEFTDSRGAYRLVRHGNTIERVRSGGLVDLTRRARSRR